MLEPSSRPGLWSASTGAAIAVIGLILLVLPVADRAAAVRLAGYSLLAAALVEAVAGVKSSRAPVRQIELLMSAVTFGAGLFVLLRPSTFPLVFLAMLCLTIRGVGALVAGARSIAGIRGWVMARGAADILLAATLMAGAPLAAVISILSGRRWPPGGGAILMNFVAISLLLTGLSLVAVGLTHRRRQASDAQES